MPIDFRESIEALAEDVQTQAKAHGGFLTGVTVGVPNGDGPRWEQALEARLSAFGYEAIDVRSVAVEGRVRVVELFYDEGWAE